MRLQSGDSVKNIQPPTINDITLTLLKHAGRHPAPFPILADVQYVAYRDYGIEHSIPCVIKGMVMRLPSMLQAMFAKGYLPTTIKGSITTMPADFLVHEQGIIRTAYYGKDEGDHLPLRQVQDFARAVKST